MACYHPLKGYESEWLTAKGTRQWVSSPKKSNGKFMDVPCGQCIGCRLERSRQWAIRCVHEARTHDKNCFITLTYNDENAPKDGSLHKRDFQLFMKRLRKAVGPLRFYHCGEYGEKNKRPHYHACLFGYDFPDKELWQQNNGFPLYRSAILEKVWPFGYSTIGDITFKSAAYIARYCMKKINGPMAEDYYTRFDPDTGEIWKIQPEYSTMSRRPGIAYEWFNQFAGDVYPDDFVLMNGKKIKPPRYYDLKFEEVHQQLFDEIKDHRKQLAKNNLDNNTPERLEVREQVQLLKLKKLIRPLEGV